MITYQELAPCLHLTPRSTHCILQKLEQSGYAEAVQETEKGYQGSSGAIRKSLLYKKAPRKLRYFVLLQSTKLQFFVLFFCYFLIRKLNDAAIYPINAANQKIFFGGAENERHKN
ncbi:hypothetical protein [Clostridium vitabionis]|jgi:hypothetical protein|uniref:hypothetical protein n=1 Tax=Clostridium vitabionis TaxID=2784388 RepID=UPI00188CFB0E|nr:hypothetical protein [Clostridium vitabionis]